MIKHSTAVQRVEFGLDTIPEDRKVTVSLRDLMYVHQTLGEFMRFFHQPLHYSRMSDVAEFLGHVNSGDAFEALHKSYYSSMPDMLPEDIEDDLGEGDRFEHPLPPKYYMSRD